MRCGICIACVTQTHTHEEERQSEMKWLRENIYQILLMVGFCAIIGVLLWAIVCNDRAFKDALKPPTDCQHAWGKWEMKERSSWNGYWQERSCEKCGWTQTARIGSK